MICQYFFVSYFMFYVGLINLLSSIFNLVFKFRFLWLMSGTNGVSNDSQFATYYELNLSFIIRYSRPGYSPFPLTMSIFFVASFVRRKRSLSSNHLLRRTRSAILCYQSSSHNQAFSMIFHMHRSTH